MTVYFCYIIEITFCKLSVKQKLTVNYFTKVKKMVNLKSENLGLCVGFF